MVIGVLNNLKTYICTCMDYIGIQLGMKCKVEVEKKSKIMKEKKINIPGSPLVKISSNHYCL